MALLVIAEQQAGRPNVEVALIVYQERNILAPVIRITFHRGKHQFILVFVQS